MSSADASIVERLGLVLRDDPDLGKALDLLRDLRLTAAAIGYFLCPSRPVSPSTVRDWMRVGGARPLGRIDPWSALRALAEGRSEARERLAEARRRFPDRRGRRLGGVDVAVWLDQLGAPPGLPKDRLRWLHTQVLEGHLEVRRTA